MKLQKILAFVLCISIITQPLAVFAQAVEISTDRPNEKSIQDASLDTSTPAVSELTPETKKIVQKEATDDEKTLSIILPEEASDTAKTKNPKATVDAPEISAMKVVNGQYIPDADSIRKYGYISTVKPTMSGNTGALTQSYAIHLPAGNAGLTPSLSLNYNSQNTQDTAYGYGWDISVPSIERLNKTGIQNLYTSKNFTSSEFGELIEVSPNNYMPKVDKGSVNSIYFGGNSWVVTDKDGTIYTYGNSQTARIENPNDSSQKAKWFLERVETKVGNYYTYQYTTDGNEVYLNKIIYTGFASDQGSFEVQLNRTSRPDIYTSYKYGFQTTLTQRVTSIQIKFLGSVVGVISLSYTSGNNGVRSMLSSVSETRTNEAGVTTSIQPTTFEYNNDTPSYSIDSTLQYNKPFQSGHILTDLDSDGSCIEPVGMLLNPNATFSFMATTMSGNYPSNSYTFSDCGLIVSAAPDAWMRYDYTATYPVERATRLVDINGDGLPDTIKGGVTQYDGVTKKVFINSGPQQVQYPGYGTYKTIYWNEQIGASVPQLVKFTGQTNDSLSVIGNINGDQLPDVLRILPGDDTYESGSSLTKGTYFGIGSSGFSTTISTMFNAPHATATSTYKLAVSTPMLIDINNDGLDDFVHSEANTTQIYINNGSGWNSTSTAAFSIPQAMGEYRTTDNIYNDLGLRFADYNNDGLVDVIQSINLGTAGTYTPAQTYVPAIPYTQNRVWINTGNSFVLSNLTTPVYWWSAVSGTLGNSTGAGIAQDVTGDGITDLLGSSYAYKGGGTKPDLLKKVIYPAGGYDVIEYSAATKELPIGGGSVSANPRVSSSIFVAKIIKSYGSDNGLIGQIEYSYSGGDNFYTGPNTKKFAGFEMVHADVKTSASTPSYYSTVQYYHQGNTSSVTYSEPADSESKIGISYRTDIGSKYGVGGALSVDKRIITNYSETNNSGSVFVYPSSTLEYSFDAQNTQSRVTATEYLYNTTTRNLSEERKKGEVTTQSTTSSTFTDVPGDSQTVVYSYATQGAITKNIKTKILDNNGNTAAETVYYYDSLPYGSINNGLLTKTEKLKTPSTYISETQEYNPRGLAINSTNPDGKTTSYTYDVLSLYKTSETNPLLQTTNYAFDRIVGQPTSITLHDGRVTSTTYDGKGRTLTISSPEGTSSTPVLKKSYMYTDTAGNVSIAESEYINQSTQRTAYVYFDGRGRIIQTKLQAEGGQWVTNDTEYGFTGKVASEYMPIYTSTSSKTPRISSYYLHTYNYDSLGRLASYFDGNNAEGYTYRGWNVEVTDPIKKNIQKYDAYGRLIGVDEKINGVMYSTSYTRDTLGNLMKLTDSQGNIRNFSYDNLSRQLTAEDLHAVADTTFTSYSFSYTNGGNLLTKTAPGSIVVSYAYDNLGRVLTEDSSTTAGTDATYTYDSCTGGLGKVCTATKNGNQTSYEYNLDGTTKKITKNILGTSYVTEYGYNRAGELLQTTYPNNTVVSQSLMIRGLPTQLSYQVSGGTSAVFADQITYNQAGMPTYTKFSNNTHECRTYDIANPMRLTGIRLTKQTIPCTISSSQTTLLPTIITTTDFIAKTDDGDMRWGPSVYYNNSYTNYVSGTNTASSTMRAGFWNANASQNIELSHAYLWFDTSSIPAAANITSATLEVTPESKQSTLAPGATGSNIFPVESWATTPLSSTTSNWNQCSNSSLSTNTPNISSLTPGAAVQFPISSPSYYIKKIPNLAFCIREGVEAYNYYYLIFNGGTYPKSDYVNLYTANSTTNKPKLTVTYTQPDTSVILQETTYTYDGIGRILTAKETGSAAGIAHSTVYTYDDQSRLTNAAITVGSATTNKTYTYNTLGNMLTQDAITYAYAGTGYANPHAPTQIGSISRTYDTRGNLLTDGTKSYTWTYDNKLASTILSGNTTTYSYDASGSRQSKTSGTSTTAYPVPGYESTSTSSRITLDLGSQTIGSLDITTGTSTAALPFFTSTDILGTPIVTTNTLGNIEESRRLSPYGGIVSNVVSGSRYDSTGYTGHTRDIGEGLIYAQARYYDPEVGVFTSQDPMFWNGVSTSKYLQNPLVHNSYGYARNNPVNNIDPNGESPVGIALVAIGTAMTAYSMYTVGSAYYNGTQDQLTGWDYAGAVPGIAFTKVGGAAVKASRALNGVEKVGEIKKLSNAAGESAKLAETISSGHSFEKHALNKSDWGDTIKTREQFQGLLQKIINNPDDYYNGGSKELFWDNKTGTIIINNPKNPTAFVPSQGKKYFDDQINKLKDNK